MSIGYQSQTKIVVNLLMTNNKLNREDALKLWLNSTTKRVIQDERKLEHISGSRCYDELILEINHDKYWLKGQFD